MRQAKIITVPNAADISVRVVTKNHTYGSKSTKQVYGSDIPAVEIKQAEYYGWHTLEEIINEATNLSTIFSREVCQEIISWCEEESLNLQSESSENN